LFIAYQFPPVGGAGVQRPVKFVKYLPRWGWQATVLAPANPSVPVFDQSLLAELPPDVTVLRARTFEPAYAVKLGHADEVPPGLMGRARRNVLRVLRAAAGVLLQPDPQILWLPAAYQMACRHLARVRHDVILATAPPYSSLVLGALLKRRFGLPLILDFRDEWDLSGQYRETFRRDALTLWAQRRLQRFVLKKADAVLATTRASAARLEEAAHAAGGNARVAAIYNGYDSADLQASGPAAPDSPARVLRLVYTGTLWNLASIEPLARACQVLAEQHQPSAAAIELTVVGRKTAQQKEWLARMARLGCAVRDIDYCDHAEVARYLAEAHVLCLLLSDVPGAERVVPAKIFEYLASGKPLLAICPAGEAADIVRRFEPDSLFLPQETARLAQWLAREVSCSGSVRGAAPRRARPGLECFSRRAQAGELAALLTQLRNERRDAP
jgi:glycosyltransferase involved in cell wall biosynthesis